MEMWIAQEATRYTRTLTGAQMTGHCWIMIDSKLR
jgi:hypothetical protein